MYDRRTRLRISACLADAFLAGEWSEPLMLERARLVLEPRKPWFAGIAGDVAAAYHRPPSDRPRELAAFIAVRLEARRESSRTKPPRVRRWLLAELAMGRTPWPVPPLASLAQLASHLDLSLGELDWLADTRSLERTARHEKLRNYRYGWLARQGGAARVIERPKARLKGIQRRVLHDVLDWIPAHGAAHGFTRGRSARSHAALHTGRYAVLSLDLQDFFASVSAGRVFGIFRTAGYPEPVAHALTGLTTNALPVDEWAAVPRRAAPQSIAAHYRLGRQLATPHIPQGAPTSPALANLAAFRLDRRLAGLAASLGITYSRYADDLTLSGPPLLVARAASVRATVAEIVREEGFVVNQRKSRLATRAGAQRVCGVVVNERLNVARSEYDVLKATLHNAARHGPAGQNRESVRDFRAHLLGRIAWVESLHPARGEKLRGQFAGIDWGD
jgi:RNA-directed DNA polymerase